MAAITTRREGRGLVTLSLKDAAEVDPGLSECATFLSRKPSSWGKYTKEIFKIPHTGQCQSCKFLQTEKKISRCIWLQIPRINCYLLWEPVEL